MTRLQSGKCRIGAGHPTHFMYANLAFKAAPALVLRLQLLSLLSKTSGLLITNTTEKSHWKEFALGIMANGDYKRTKGLRGPVDLSVLERLEPATNQAAFDASVFLNEAMESAVDIFASVANGSVPYYAKHFMESHNEQEVKTDSATREHAAEILAAYGRAMSALERARNGAPHIYALIVYGKEQDSDEWGAMRASANLQ